MEGRMSLVVKRMCTQVVPMSLKSNPGRHVPVALNGGSRRLYCSTLPVRRSRFCQTSSSGEGRFQKSSSVEKVHAASLEGWCKPCRILAAVIFGRGSRAQRKLRAAGGRPRPSCRLEQARLRQTRLDSCRNRHWPKCQSLAKAQWLAARQAELLPVPYFMSSLPCPSGRRRWFYKMPGSFTISCSRPSRKPCSALPPTPSIWVLASVFW